MNEPRISVLLVDDDDPFRFSAELLLSSKDAYEVIACSSGESALEVLEKRSIDVMVLDHQMPGLTGLNVLQQLHERKHIVPTLMLTGAGSEHIAVEAMKLGAFDYIRKDHLELKRLPLVINGIHERKLFRDDRLGREQARVRAEERTAAEESLRDAIAFLEKKVTTSSAECFRLANEAEIASRDHSAPDGPQIREDAFRMLRRQLDLIASDLLSITNLSFILHADPSRSRTAPQTPGPGVDAVPHSAPADDQKNL